ncbi:FtsX-like permease family protein [Ornithinimicrobium pekingense]|nr:FtsX-like permease family protein [Ornithinimicrobium pekingense]
MTSWWGWALRRARASTGLLLTLLALVTATTAILAGAVGYSGAAATTAAREALTGAVPGEAGIRVQTRQAEDPQAQDAAARQRIAQAFDPAPVSVQRTVVSTPRPASLDGTRLDGGLVAVASGSLTTDAPGAGERVDVVEGSWPREGSLEGMLHAGTATEWEVSVGDTLEVGGAEVAVVGLWRPVDAEDAFWFGDPLVAAGRDGDQRGPLVVAPGSVGDLVDAPFVRWTVQPDASQIQPDDLAHLASAAGSLRSSLKTPEVEVRGVTVDGDLAPTAATASRNLATANALGVIPLSVLTLVTLLAVTQLARLLSTTREAQAQLLVARGATRTQVLVGTVAEAAVVTVVGAALGALAAWAVLGTVPAGDAQGATVVRVAAVSGLAVLAVLAAVAVLQVRRLTAGGRADMSGRTRAATALATLVLVLGAAAVAWWQLRRTGSPLVTREDGTLGTDLVAGAAPALLLAAAAVVAMALLGPLGRLAESLTRPSRRAGGHLAAAQVSRRLPVYAVPAVLTVLAVGATTLAGLYSGTSAALRDNLAAVAQGAPVRASLDEPPRTTAPGAVPAPPALPEVPGSTSTPVWLDADARLGDLTLPLTMADVEELGRVASVPDLPEDAPLVPADALTTEAAAREGLAVPEGTREVTAVLDVELTVPERDLTTIQRGFEQTVRDVQEGTYGAPQEDLEAARSAARQMTDSMLLTSMGQVEWGVTLLLVEQGSGLYQEVSSAPVTVDLPQVRPPWLDLDAAADPAPGEDPVAEVPEGTVVDYTLAQVRQGGGSADLTFTLPEGTAWTLTGVRLSTPRHQDSFWGFVSPAVEASLSLRTDDGTDLLGAPTAGWGSDQLATPEAVARAEEANAGLDPEETTTTVLPDGSVLVSDGATAVFGALDTSGPRWSISADSDHLFPEAATVGPGLEVEDATVTGHGAPPPDDVPSEDAALPVALTVQAARAASLTLGDRAELTAFSTRLPVRVAAVVPAVPGTLAPQAVLLDRDTVAAHYAQAGRTLPHPTELWVRPAGGDAAPVVEELAGAEGVGAVAGPGRVAVTDATSAARLVFWVASAGAVLLAVTGIAAVAATLLGHRRAEVAVLRALGMPPRTQARSRALELGGVVLASIALGLVASWLVGLAVVPELALSTTLPGQVSLPSALLLEPGPWAVLLGVGLVAVLAVVLLQAGRVRAQALDGDYREEIR